MSRGLGKLQREILDNLERSTDGTVVFFYPGGNNAEPPIFPYRRAWHAGQRFKIADGVYDLRAVKRVVARGDPHKRFTHMEFYDPAYDVSFHRAVKSLVQRGELEDRGPRWYDTGTGTDRKMTRQIRFVTRPGLSAKEGCLALTDDHAEAAAS